MGLSASSEEYIGKRLYVKPNYGYGWSSPENFNLEDQYFEITLLSLWSFEGKLRGGIGKVEASQLSLENLWVVFSTRHEKPYDFISNLGPYNLQFHMELPVESENGWPLSDHPHPTSGWGEVRSYEV